MSDDTTPPFKIYKRPLSTQYDIYLSDTVESDSTQYMDLLKALSQASEDDIVHLFLANFGGAVHTGLRIAHGLRNCAATTIVRVEAPCYSMGAIIAVCGDALTMEPGTMLMFHNYSTVEMGKGGEVGAAVEQFNKHFYKSLENLAHPFLTKGEITKLRNDQDVYIHSDDKDLSQRMIRHFPLLKAQEKKRKKTKA